MYKFFHFYAISYTLFAVACMFCTNVENVSSVKPTLVDKDAECEIKSEMKSTSDGGVALRVDDGSKCSDNVTSAVQFADADGYVVEADVTGRAETDCASTDNVPRKRSRRRKSGWTILALECIALYQLLLWPRGCLWVCHVEVLCPND